MEFDKSRVYTSANADELKVGSKVIVADDIATLKKMVSEGECRVLSRICSEGFMYRFRVRFSAGNACGDWNLAYLVSEPEEKKLKWQDVNIGDVLYRKSNPEVQFLVTGKSFNANTDRHIYVSEEWALDTVLEKEYAKVGELENESAEVGDEDD